MKMKTFNVIHIFYIFSFCVNLKLVARPTVFVYVNIAMPPNEEIM